MRRVVVVGSGGAGKTTLSDAIGRVLDLPVIHLDELFWKPGWVETPGAAWRELQREVVRGEAWVIDGNYGATFDIRMAAADTVVFLDYGRLRSLARAARRSVLNHGRAVQAAGCPEHLNWSFLRWCWRYPVDSRPRTLDALAAHAGHATVLTLRTPREADALLRRLEAERRLEDRSG